jgi:hypothetical protein
VPVFFSQALKDSKYVINQCLQPNATQISADTTAEIITTPLTLIVSEGQGVCISVNLIIHAASRAKKDNDVRKIIFRH